MDNNEEIIDAKADSKMMHYTKVILSGVLDQIFAIGLSLIAFGIFDLALRIFG